VETASERTGAGEVSAVTGSGGAHHNALRQNVARPAWEKLRHGTAGSTGNKGSRTSQRRGDRGRGGHVLNGDRS
jgi:hypothetical protein